MMYLILSILCTASFILLFKWFERFDIHVFQAIVFNYWVAAGCGLFFVEGYSFTQIMNADWLWFAFVLGVSFIIIFTCTAETVKLFNVSTASVAMKLGLVFPVTFAFLIYGEGYNTVKLIGIVFAFIAVVLATYRSSGEHHQHKSWQFVLPLIVFVGSGLCDSGVQFANKKLLASSDVGAFVMTNFFAAGVAGSFVSIYQIATKRVSLKLQNIFGGIAVGIPNYFSFLFMLKALETMDWGSSIIFPVSNLSTIACSSLAAFIFFKERISVMNLTGLGFAAASIILIILSSYQ